MNTIHLDSYQTNQSDIISNLNVHYQIFGEESAKPPILVIHALTGNSNVVGENGWGKEIIGANKSIDTNQYQVIAINIPGNDYAQNEDILNYQNLLRPIFHMKLD